MVLVSNARPGDQVDLCSNNFRLNIKSKYGNTGIIHLYQIEYPPSLPKDNQDLRREALRNVRDAYRQTLGDPCIALGSQLFAMTLSEDTKYFELVTAAGGQQHTLVFKHALEFNLTSWSEN